MKGIVMLAHGSRDPQWVEPFEQICSAVESRRPECAVALAYLEHSVPDLSGAVDDLIARGATHVEVVPVFLGSGGHVRNDVPQLVQRARERHTHVRFAVKPFIGEARAVLDAIADYASS